MATIKSFTDLPQSKVLAEFLPLESADMSYLSEESLVPKIIYNGMAFFNSKEERPTNIIYCWSLTALLDVLPDYTLQTNTDGTVFVICDSKKPMISDAYSNPVDACYEMIIKLHELNLL